MSSTEKYEIVLANRERLESLCRATQEKSDNVRQLESFAQSEYLRGWAHALGEKLLHPLRLVERFQTDTARARANERLSPEALENDMWRANATVGSHRERFLDHIAADYNTGYAHALFYAIQLIYPDYAARLPQKPHAYDELHIRVPL